MSGATPTSASSVTSLLAAFADPNPSSFDAIDWVNAALGATTAPGSTDTHISSLIVKLQLLSQDTTDAIEASMTHMVGALPRTERELTQIKADAADLTGEFNAVLSQPQHAAAPNADPDAQEESKDPPPSTAPTLPPAYIDELETLDLIKSNMEETKDLLHEAAAWERLVREVDVVLDGTDLSRTADHIAMLQRSAHVLGDMPGADGRRATLASVKERFEAMVQPQLETALATDDGDNLERLVRVFGRMGRSQFLAAEFARARVRPLRDMWREADDSPDSAFPGSGALLEWTTAFYTDCLRTLSRETRRVHRLFPPQSTALVLARLVTEVWDPSFLPSARPLSPTSGTGITDDLDISKSFRKRLDTHGSFADVVPLFHAARKFGAEVADALPTAVSQRLALAAVGVPFEWYQRQYGVLERDFLLDRLRALDVSKPNLPTTVAALEAALRDVQSAAMDAVERCAALTLATEVDGLLLALSAYFDELLGLAQRLVGMLTTAASRPAGANAADDDDDDDDDGEGDGDGDGGGGADRDEKKTDDGRGSGSGSGSSGVSSFVDQFNVDSNTFALGLRVLNLSDKLMRLVVDVDEQCRAIVCHHRTVLLYGADTARAWRAEVEADTNDSATAAAAAASTPGDELSAAPASPRASGASPEPGATSPRSPPLSATAPMRMRSPSDFRLRAGSSSGGGGGHDAVPDGHDVAMLCAQQALADSPAKADALKTMVHECMSGSCLLPASIELCRQFDHGVQEVLYKMMLGPVRARLAAFPGADEWTRKSPGDGGGGGGGGGGGDEDDVMFSLQPLPYITAIGEHLLVTVRLLEPLARGDIRRTAQMDPDDFLRFGKDVWESVSALLSVTRPYRTSDTEMEARLVIESTLSAPARRTRRESITGSPSGHDRRDGALSPAGTSATEIARSYSTLWLAAIVRGCVCLVLQRMLAVRAVSAAGARQLASDLEYLTNVLQALGFGADPLLPRFRELLVMAAPGLSSLIEASSTITASAQDFEEARLRRHVAQMRDILTTF